jgi:hypothetical protein
MSFDYTNFTQMSYGAGNAIWYYKSSDNLASNVKGVINATYFKTAFTENAIPVKEGDIIIHNNQASKLTTIFSVYDDFDANGASVAAVAGIHTLY